MNEELLTQLRGLRGMVATVVTSGSVEDGFSQCLSDLRSWCDRANFHSIEWRKFKNPFVETGRDEVLHHARMEGYDWVLQIDADAAPFSPEALVQILTTAFITHPDADVVGAYAQLKAEPYLPTIDTGTGTWEIHYPGEGVLPVIRTGGHFLLIKPPILSRFGPPWFRTRQTIRPMDAMAEIDNMARISMSGANPLAETDAWQELLTKTREEGGGVVSVVGEDSGFCDAVMAVGGRIYVDTNIWVGHVGKRVITPDLLSDAMVAQRRLLRASVGVWE